MKTSKIDPMRRDGNMRSGYGDVLFIDCGDDPLTAVDMALKSFGLEVQIFPNFAINADAFRIVKRK